MLGRHPPLPPRSSLHVWVRGEHPGVRGPEIERGPRDLMITRARDGA
eukprot:SAG31_NODE_243_length_19342_cov_12.906459_19_plen_47_part_00